MPLTLFIKTYLMLHLASLALLLPVRWRLPAARPLDRGQQLLRYSNGAKRLRAHWQLLRHDDPRIRRREQRVRTSRRHQPRVLIIVHRVARRARNDDSGLRRRLLLRVQAADDHESERTSMQRTQPRRR